MSKNKHARVPESSHALQTGKFPNLSAPERLW